MVASRPGPDRVWLLLPVLAMALVAGWAAAWWRFTIDDTYIFCRYAANFADGEGLVFNPGERVEGHSSPAWVLVLATAAVLRADPVAASKALGVACALALVPLTFAALRRAGTGPGLSAAAAVWVAAVPGLHVYAASGMETVPFALAVATLALLPAFLRPIDGPSRTSGGQRRIALALALIAVATLRPEGPMLALLASVAWLVHDRSSAARRTLGSVWAVLVLGWIARAAYYGTLLPNTFRAKPSPLLWSLRHDPFGERTGEALRASLEQFAGAVGQSGGIGVLAAAVVAVFLLGRTWVVSGAALVLLGGWTFVLYAPPDWMPQGRFSLPFVVPLVFLAALGLDALRRRMGRRGRLALGVGVALSLAAWIAIAQDSTLRQWRYHREGRTIKALDAVPRHRPIGEWLRAQARPGDSVLAYEVGAVGYFSGLTVVDHEGLVTPEVAAVVHSAGGYHGVRHGTDPEALDRVVDAVSRRNPDWFLVRCRNEMSLSVGAPVPPEAANEAIQKALIRRVGPGLVLRAVFPMGGNDRYLLLGRAS